MTECISEGLYRIPVPLPGNPLRELNSYLLRGRERSLLIDTGFRREWPVLSSPAPDRRRAAALCLPGWQSWMWTPGM